MKNCGNKVKHTCGTTNYSTCIHWEGDVNPQSELVDNTCLDQELVDQDQYNQLENIWNEIDLSELSSDCLDYLKDDNDKIIVKNVLLKHEEKICELEEKIKILETTDICNKSIASCNLDLSCLDLLPCDTPINTLGDLLQSMINKICETP